MINISLLCRSPLVNNSNLAYFFPYNNCGIQYISANGVDLLGQIKNSTKLPDICFIEHMSEGCYQFASQVKNVFPATRTVVFSPGLPALSLMFYLFYRIDAYLGSSPFCMPATIFDSIMSGKTYFPAESLKAMQDFYEKKDIKNWRLIFSRSELLVMGMTMENATMKEIAFQLNISISTTKTLFHRIYCKLKISSRIELVQCLNEIGWEPCMRNAGMEK